MQSHNNSTAFYLNRPHATANSSYVAGGTSTIDLNGNSGLMFGVQAISEDSIATQGFVKLGVQELSGVFTQQTPAIKITSAIDELTSSFT